MKYLIRPMTEDDINQIVEGETNIFGESLGFDMLYSDLKLNPYANYLVLEINRKIRGYIGLWINEENAEVINFYIDKKFQGLGFGKMLLEFAIDLCKLSHVTNLSLEVRKSNVKAISLYEKYGFVYGYTREDYYLDHEDALVLIKNFEVKK